MCWERNQVGNQGAVAPPTPQDRTSDDMAVGIADATDPLVAPGCSAEMIACKVPPSSEVDHSSSPVASRGGYMRDAGLGDPTDGRGQGSECVSEQVMTPGTIDRGDEEVAKIYDPAHLSVLRLIKLSAESAKKVGVPNNRSPTPNIDWIKIKVVKIKTS